MWKLRSVLVVLLLLVVMLVVYVDLTLCMYIRDGHIESVSGDTEVIVVSSNHHTELMMLVIDVDSNGNTVDIYEVARWTTPEKVFYLMKDRIYLIVEYTPLMVSQYLSANEILKGIDVTVLSMKKIILRKDINHIRVLM